MGSNVRLKQLNGIIDDQGVLTITPSKLASQYENMVNEITVELPDEILSTYRVYFDFILPSKERFISEPLVPEVSSKEVINQFTRLPETKEILIVKYKVNAYVTRFAGPCLLSIKASNDSVTLYKSDLCTLTINSNTDSEIDDRYFRGDLLDYLVARKLDDVEYTNGWMYAYATNPTLVKTYKVNLGPDGKSIISVQSGDEIIPVVDRKFTINDTEYVINHYEGLISDYVSDGTNEYPINSNKEFTLGRLLIARFPMIVPTFESEEAAADWAKNSGESSIGQFLSALYLETDADEDDIEGWKSVGYIINPDLSLNKLSNDGQVDYSRLENKPTITTNNDPGTLDPLDKEKLGKWTKDEDGHYIYNGNINLTRVAKTGKLSDTINDRNFLTSHSIKITNNGTYQFPLKLLTDNYDRDLSGYFTVNKVIINRGFIGEEFSVKYNGETLFDNIEIDMSEPMEVELGYHREVVAGADFLDIEVNGTGAIDILILITYN